MSIIKTIGIELEGVATSASHSTLAEMITFNGVPCSVDSITGSTQPTWKIVSDSSVSGHGHAFELVSRVLKTNENWQQEIRLALGNVIDSGVGVNTTTGFHVHLGVAHLDLPILKRIIERWSDHESVIDGLVTHDRRNGSFCRPSRLDGRARYLLNTADCIEGLALVFGQDRYRKLNVMPLAIRHNAPRALGTFEVRVHSGTFDAEKVINWIDLLLAFCDESARQVTSRQSAASVAPVQPETGFNAALYSGKKRQIIDALFSEGGIDAEAMCQRLGWQRHSLSGDVTHIKQQILEPAGFTVARFKIGATQYYKAVPLPNGASVPVAVAVREVDTLWRGVPVALRTYWENRQRYIASLDQRRAA